MHHKALGALVWAVLLLAGPAVADQFAIRTCDTARDGRVNVAPAIFSMPTEYGPPIANANAFIDNPGTAGCTEVGSTRGLEALFSPLGEAAPEMSADPGMQAQACCKICRTGKACGDSCIKKSHTCTKPPGCACDAN